MTEWSDIIALPMTIFLWYIATGIVRIPYLNILVLCTRHCSYIEWMWFNVNVKPAISSNLSD